MTSTQYSLSYSPQVDRHNTYREIFGLFFPHHEHLERPLRSTVVDAELVIDVDPRTKRVRHVIRILVGHHNERFHSP